MLDSLKKTIGNAAKNAGYTALNALLNSEKVVGLANSKIGRYAEVKSIHKNAECFAIVAQLKGLSENFQVNIKNIAVNDDGSALILTGFSSNFEGINNLLHDFAEGRSIPVPEKYQGIVLKIKSFL